MRQKRYVLVLLSPGDGWGAALGIDGQYMAIEDWQYRRLVSFGVVPTEYRTKTEDAASSQGGVHARATDKHSDVPVDVVPHSPLCIFKDGHEGECRWKASEARCE